LTIFGHFVHSLRLRAGSRIFPDARVRRLAHARKLKLVFRQFDIGFVLDVGANIGQFHDFLRADVGFAGPIHSFEPLPDLVAKMRARRAADPLWTVHDFALGAEAALRVINVAEWDVFSSFLEPAPESVPEFERFSAAARQERVRIETLDGIAATTLASVDLDRAFLKLDTQGFDLEVLRGGRAAISRIPALQTEVSVRPVYQGMPGMAQSIAAFGELGFAPSDLFVVSEDKGLRAVEFDCLMVRDLRVRAMKAARLPARNRIDAGA